MNPSTHGHESESDLGRRAGAAVLERVPKQTHGPYSLGRLYEHAPFILHFHFPTKG